MNRFIFLLLGIFSSLFSPSVAQKYTYLGTNKLYYGASYYPESWPASNLAEDIKQMKAANINVVRMAEFSWSKMEPEEGVYTFEWLHNIIEALHKNGIDVILGTPSATPPAWLWEKYPEIANVRDNGFVEIHGARRNTNYTNELWRKKATGIAEKMAVEFGNKPGVIGWQIDNELGLYADYSEHTRKRWIEYLRTKYGSIENLNQLWATDLWSQTYQRFEQIPMPVSQIWHHNSLRFEWSRFTSL
ncbi:MAG: beta-galactosidase, partial [Cyclobacteriaceae bacterium]